MSFFYLVSHYIKYRSIASPGSSTWCIRTCTRGGRRARSFPPLLSSAGPSPSSSARRLWSAGGRTTSSPASCSARSTRSTRTSRIKSPWSPSATLYPVSSSPSATRASDVWCTGQFLRLCDRGARVCVL